MLFTTSIGNVVSGVSNYIDDINDGQTVMIS